MIFYLLPQVGALGVGMVWGWMLGMLVVHRPGEDWRKLLFGSGGSLLIGALAVWITNTGAVVWFVAGTIISLTINRLWLRYLKKRSV